MNAYDDLTFTSFDSCFSSHPSYAHSPSTTAHCLSFRIPPHASAYLDCPFRCLRLWSLLAVYDSKLGEDARRGRFWGSSVRNGSPSRGTVAEKTKGPLRSALIRACLRWTSVRSSCSHCGALLSTALSTFTVASDLRACLSHILPSSSSASHRVPVRLPRVIVLLSTCDITDATLVL